MKEYQLILTVLQFIPFLSVGVFIIYLNVKFGRRVLSQFFDSNEDFIRYGNSIEKFSKIKRGKVLKCILAIFSLQVLFIFLASILRFRYPELFGSDWF